MGMGAVPVCPLSRAAANGGPLGDGVSASNGDDTVEAFPSLIQVGFGSSGGVFSTSSAHLCISRRSADPPLVDARLIDARLAEARLVADLPRIIIAHRAPSGIGGCTWSGTGCKKALRSSRIWFAA